MIYLFDRYEVDDENLWLTRDTERLPLEPKAFRLLLLMVRNPGKLLTKEAILAAVWAGVIVEESSLSRAVALLRKQLRDDPRQPRFIATVPTLGYRFLPAVTHPTATVPESNAASPGPDPKRLRPSMRALVLAAAGLLIVSAVLMTLFHKGTVHPSKAGRKSIVLADFSNATGDPVFDGTLRQGMLVQLEQSPVLSIVPEQRVQRLLQMMGQPADVRLTAAMARELCQRDGSVASLSGSITKLGSQYVLGLEAIDCDSGALIDSEQMPADRKENVLEVLSDIATKFRAKLGESLASVSSLDTPLAEATTASLEALQAFTEANKILSANGSAAALPFFDRAVELDPQFALAYAMRGRAYGDAGQEVDSANSTAAAYRYRERASETERLFITASYALQVTGNLEQANETCDAWRELYPLASAPYGFPAGVILRVFGQYEAGAQAGRRMVELGRDFSIPYHLLVSNLIPLGHWSEAEAVLRDAGRRNLQIPFYYLDRYRLYFLRGDEAGMHRIATQAATQPGAQDMLANQEAAVFAYHGQLTESRQSARAAVALARSSGRRESAARLQAATGLRDALFGASREAVTAANAALEISNGRDVQYGAALALAIADESTRAAALTDELEARLPEDTSVRFHYVPTLRAVLALHRGEPAKALELLQANARYEWGSPQSSFGGYYGALYPMYVRGLTFLSLHRDAEAAKEFQRIIDHPGIVATDPIGALSLLQMARAYRGSGNNDKSRAAYATLAGLWKDANTDGILFRQVSREVQAGVP